MLINFASSVFVLFLFTKCLTSSNNLFSHGMHESSFGIVSCTAQWLRFFWFSWRFIILTIDDSWLYQIIFVTEMITTHKCFIMSLLFSFEYFHKLMNETTFQLNWYTKTNGSFWILNWVFLFAYRWCLNMKFKFNRNELWIFLDINNESSCITQL